MYNGVKVLDVHGHVMAPGNNFAMLLMASNTPARSPFSEGGRRGEDLSEEAFQKAADRHVKYLDERDIDVQVIGPRPFTAFGWMEPHLLPSWVRFTNDRIKIECDLYPDRFAGAGMVYQDASAPDTRHCLPELNRCVEELGFIAGYITPDPDGRRTAPGMFDPYWFPLYERAQELNIPLIVHGTNSLDPRIRTIPANYQVGFLVEQYIAAQALNNSDVFDRYPDLKVLVCHCGGALDRFIPSDHRHLGPRDSSNNMFYDSCGYDLLFLEAAIKQRGVKRIAFGSEAPGAGDAIRPETGKTCDDLVPIIAGFDFLSEDDKVQIFNANPRRVIPGLARF